ncbi:MAG TPA: hypothetical protein VGD61_04360 [Pyrinomonadaceae bacterium]
MKLVADVPATSDIEDDLPRWIFFYARSGAFEFISMTIQSNLRALLAALEL